MFGLQVFAENGKEPLINIYNRTTMLLGEFEIASESGEYVDDNLLQGTPWWVSAAKTGFYLGYDRQNETIITASGNKLVWTQGHRLRPCIVVYGIML